MPPFKERYLKVVHYGSNPSIDQSGPITDHSDAKENQVVSDWNRMLKGEVKCTYYINGTNLSELRDNKPFENPNDLKNFLKEHLLKHTLTAEEQAALNTNTPEGVAAEKKLSQLTEFTFMHCHQGGLPHATNYSLIAARTDALRLTRVIPDPKIAVHFNATPEGLIIEEKNTYTEWTENPGLHQKKHISTAKGKPFYAQTNSTYLITPDTKNIELLDLEINCPSENLKPIFNKLDEHKQVIQGRFSTMLIKLGLKSLPRADDTPEEGHAYFYKDGQEFDSNADTAPPSEASGSDSGFEDEPPRGPDIKA
jgi:hypothetical protein